MFSSSAKTLTYSLLLIMNSFSVDYFFIGVGELLFRHEVSKKLVILLKGVGNSFCWNVGLYRVGLVFY